MQITMPTYCPRDTCAWTSPDGKCHWPTDNCPYKAEREAAEKQQQSAKEAMAEAKRKKRHEDIADIPAGVHQMDSGRWEATIAVVSHKKVKTYYLGTYDTMEQAAAVRKLAELHRKNGDLDEWIHKNTSR